jgi:hypothetical protein
MRLFVSILKSQYSDLRSKPFFDILEEVIEKREDNSRDRCEVLDMGRETAAKLSQYSNHNTQILNK